MTDEKPIPLWLDVVDGEIWLADEAHAAIYDSNDRTTIDGCLRWRSCVAEALGLVEPRGPSAADKFEVEIRDFMAKAYGDNKRWNDLTAAQKAESSQTIAESIERDIVEQRRVMEARKQAATDKAIAAELRRLAEAIRGKTEDMHPHHPADMLDARADELDPPTAG